MNNQTFKNERNNSGADNKKALESAIRSIWQERQDSNLRPSVLETDALPTELLSFRVVLIIPF